MFSLRGGTGNFMLPVPYFRVYGMNTGKFFIRGVLISKRLKVSGTL